MSKKEKATLLPRLRFPEFQAMKEWELSHLNALAVKVTSKNKEALVTRVLTNSAVDGVVDQSDYFEREIVTQSNIGNYLIINEGDFVYNPRISSSAPVGPISKNKVGRGIMSPLYTIFRFNNPCNDFYEQYFKTNLWNGYLKVVSNTGARHDRISISADKFMEMPLPSSSTMEQQKIADCLSSIDDLITAEDKKLSALKDHKKGLMQKLFPAEGETVPEWRFPEFRNSGEWEEKILLQVVTSITNGLSMEQVENSKGYAVTRIETISDQTINIKRVGHVQTTQDISSYKLNIGDILFSNINSLRQIGKVAIIEKDYDLYHGMNLLRLQIVTKQNSPKFMFYLLNTELLKYSFRSRANQAINQASINQTELGKTSIIIPSLKEQQKIADCISSVDVLIAAQTEKIEDLKSHKKGLIQGLFPSIEEVEA